MLVFSTYHGLFLLMLVEVFQLRNRITHGVTKIILKERVNQSQRNSLLSRILLSISINFL